MGARGMHHSFIKCTLQLVQPLTLCLTIQLIRHCGQPTKPPILTHQDRGPVLFQKPNFKEIHAFTHQGTPACRECAPSFQRCEFEGLSCPCIRKSSGAVRCARYNKAKRKARCQVGMSAV
eukprot:1158567-Pelagomonas_calceolata.AAC.5